MTHKVPVQGSVRGCADVSAHTVCVCARLKGAAHTSHTRNARILVGAIGVVIGGLLSACGGSSEAPAPPPAVTPSWKVDIPPLTPPPPSTRPKAHPGSYCSPEGAKGTTKTGTTLQCIRKPGEDRARWRKP